ncbi:hypothetical protein T11_3283 [Trichinella zimbabwensis]|uniref:Uncharacterized protein n=1 Tax=Trichinella zimbabwensis TaxID=268475 RepID=A0A0V1H765_9BILA|nr:hypothetical protein T11_3283 [Trichinella zimbabwensis]
MYCNSSSSISFCSRQRETSKRTNRTIEIEILEERMGGTVLLVSTTNNYACWAMSLALAHSGQRMSGPSVMKP